MADQCVSSSLYVRKLESENRVGEAAQAVNNLKLDGVTALPMISYETGKYTQLKIDGLPCLKTPGREKLVAQIVDVVPEIRTHHVAQKNYSTK